MATEEEKAYAVRRAQKQNPNVVISSWDGLMELPLNSVSLDTFNELLESDLFEVDETQFRMQKQKETN